MRPTNLRGTTMATFTDVFERKEIKYRLSAGQHRMVLGALAGRMAPDLYGRTCVSSLYFDTADRLLIDRSLEKPLYKEKLRLRWYGALREGDRVYLEVKKKFKGVVYKRRIGCSYAAARAYLEGMPYEQACTRHPLDDPLMNAEAAAPRSVQIAGEIDQFILRYQPLRPSMLIACERTAYVPVEGLKTGAPSGAADGLRITFDEGITYCDLLQSRTGRAGEGTASPLTASGEAVMEIKASGPYPLWLVHGLPDVVLEVRRGVPSVRLEEGRPLCLMRL